MKNTILKVMTLVCILIASVQTIAQINDLKKLEGKLKKQVWEKIKTDPQIKILINELNARGFSILENEQYFSGFNATFTEDNVKKDAFIYAFDFNKKGYNGLASVIWKQVGNDSYKALIVFPEIQEKVEKGDTKKLIALAFSQAYENAEEYYINKDNKLEKANSWRRCFRKCIEKGNTVVQIGKSNVKTNCKMNCLAAVAVCGGTMAVMAATGALPTAGLSVPIAAGIFFFCAGAGCSVCFAACAIGCP